MTRNMLYIMSGLPYSGKTTLVKKLANKISFKVVSVDIILEQKDLWKEKHPTQENWETAYAEACKKVENNLINGENIIFDESNLQYSQRENLRKMAKNLRVRTRLIYTKIDKNEVLKRWKENLKIKQKNQLSEEIIQRTFSLFEEPKQEENPIIYNQNDDFESWFEINFESRAGVEPT